MKISKKHENYLNRPFSPQLWMFDLRAAAACQAKWALTKDMRMRQRKAEEAEWKKGGTGVTNINVWPYTATPMPINHFTDPSLLKIRVQPGHNSAKETTRSSLVALAGQYSVLV